MVKKTNLLLINALVLSSPLTRAEENTYVVKRGETLSQIMQRLLPEERIYTKNGTLKRVILVNPDVKNPDRVYVGQTIILPFVSVPVPVVNEPVIVPAPVESVRAVTSEEEVNHSVEVFSGMNSTSFDIHDKVNSANATLTTSRDIVVGASLKQEWTKSFESFFTLSARNVDFEAPTHSSRQIINKDQTNFGMELGAYTYLTKDLSFKTSLSQTKEIFVHGADTDNIYIDHFAIYGGNLALKYNVFTKGSTSMGFIAGGTYLFSANGDAYKISNGRSFSSSVYLRRKFGSSSVFGLDVGYKQRKQNTTIVDLNEKGSYFLINFSFPIFGGK